MKINFLYILQGHLVAQLVETLRYKPEGRGFDLRYKPEGRGFDLR